MAFFQNQSKKSGNRVTILRGVRSVSFPAVIFVVVARDVNIATFILHSRNLPVSNSHNDATSELTVWPEVAKNRKSGDFWLLCGAKILRWRVAKKWRFLNFGQFCQKCGYFKTKSGDFFKKLGPSHIAPETAKKVRKWYASKKFTGKFFEPNFNQIYI